MKSIPLKMKDHFFGLPYPAANYRFHHEKGDLGYEIGENVIIGKNAYRTITVLRLVTKHKKRSFRDLVANRRKKEI